MRRAVFALGGTVAGLAALFSYKTHAPTVAALNTPITPGQSAGAQMASPGNPTPTMKPPTTKPSATKKAAPKATKRKAAPASTPTTQAPPPKPSGTFSGGTVNTQYGPVQVTITVSGGRITAASDPDGGDGIGQNAAYRLDQEAVQAQSANIQAVSGATYTSQGYIQSLQQAIDSAGL